MRRRYAHITLVLALTLTLGFLAACSTPEPETIEVTRVVEVEVPVEGPTVEVTRLVEVAVEPEQEPVALTEFQTAWAGSAHADASSEAFVHWDEDDPAEVPPACANCHSTPGHIDFLGADGTEAGVVDNAAPIGTVVECEACHNDAASAKTSVVFPSGVEVMGLGDEARCMDCHQGRASKLTVDQSIMEAGLTPEDEDTVSEDLGFDNIHYYAAAATQYGTLTMGGYEFEGKSYDARFEHVAPYDTCVDCHNPHTLEVKLEECTTCHEGVREAEDLVDVRGVGSLVDYDGDGDMEEGIYYEIEDMRAILYETMQAYAADVAGTPLIHANNYPYFFIDSNANGEVDEDETAFPNGFNAWTPRLAKAAYNYQVSLKDPGRYAHGGKYVIQLLFDSIEHLNEALSEPVDMSEMRRIDHGHFAGSEEAFRHWDEDGEVDASCARCHTAEGLPFFVEHGVSISQEPSNGLNCATCHDNVVDATIHRVDEVTFPSGAVLSTGDGGSNLCLNCHQGRESAVSVDRLIGDLGPDEMSESLRFLNVHYFAAGASVFGTEAKGAYEYAGQTYVGRNVHVESFDTCTECHNTHMLTVVVDDCSVCHAGVESPEDLAAIRFNEDEVYVDWDGDGDLEEGMAGEIETMHTALYSAMQAYAADTLGSGVLYSSASYPYFFTDLNGNGEADADEINFGNQFQSWTPRLLRAAYNYQYVAKDPGMYAHNGDYAVQILYDSLVDLGGDTAGMSRP